MCSFICAQLINTISQYSYNVQSIMCMFMCQVYHQLFSSGSFLFSLVLSSSTSSLFPLSSVVPIYIYIFIHSMFKLGRIILYHLIDGNFIDLFFIDRKKNKAISYMDDFIHIRQTIFLSFSHFCDNLFIMCVCVCIRCSLVCVGCNIMFSEWFTGSHYFLSLSLLSAVVVIINFSL